MKSQFLTSFDKILPTVRFEIYFLSLCDAFMFIYIFRTCIVPLRTLTVRFAL